MLARRFFLTAVVVLATLPATAGDKVHRLALQISDDTPEKMTAVLNVAANVSRYYSEQGEEVEVRNDAEALTFQAERVVKDLGDKLPSEDKLEIENKVSGLREALKGSDIDAVRSQMSSLSESLQRVSTAAYQAAGAAGAGESTDGASSDGADGAGTDGADEAAAEGEETVEGEFKEV